MSAAVLPLYLEKRKKSCHVSFPDWAYVALMIEQRSNSRQARCGESQTAAGLPMMHT